MNTTTASKIMISFTNSGPFLEENVVSRQVDKSIYAKNQLYDGQTQCTEQTIVFCAAVKAELKTVSEFAEENKIYLRYQYIIILLRNYHAITNF